MSPETPIYDELLERYPDSGLGAEPQGTAAPDPEES